MSDLHRIVYTSRQTVPDGAEERIAGLGGLVSSGRRHNGRTGLTSVLALHRGCFVQVIEGPREAAEATFARIRHDARHRDIALLRSGPARGRRFPGHALTLIGQSAAGRARLDDLAGRSGSDLGGAEPAALLRVLAEVLAQEGPDAGGADGAAEQEAFDAVFATAVFSADRRVLRANARFEALFGFGRGGLAGLSLDPFVHPDDRRKRDGLWAAMARGDLRTLDYRGKGRAGVEVRLRSTFRPRLDAAGALRDVVEMGTELTEVRRRRSGPGGLGLSAPAADDGSSALRRAADDLRRGMAAGEIFLDYQPRFDPRDRRLRSVEALVRWRHPERGRIGPADFIPLAETSGLVVPLGAWVLGEACRTAAPWEGVGVSVNVSPVQFRDGDLVPTVQAALAESGLDPRRLELEITESMLFEDAERAGAALTALKDLGVRLAMDDFGTGYASLSALRSFPFDVIKIDRHFVADMDVRQGGRAVVQAILALGRALGLSVTAEGVETPSQLTMLTVDGCPEVQGYLLARPMAAADIVALLAARGAATAGPPAPAPVPA